MGGKLQIHSYARGLQPECARVIHEGLFVPALLYGRDNDMERKGEV